ncbi:MAG TPA: EamA family transporter [Bryobacteraceae bacterium]|nr:EamA family transporter [Bryobacteraceae bacterium]
MKTPLSSILLVLLSAFIGSFGAVLLKSGSSRLSRTWQSLFLNTRIIFGVGLFLFSSIFAVLAMREGELSVLYPMSSFASILTMFWSRLFFGEPLTRKKFVGLGLIIAGITCLFSHR